jgi:hypothetical protein
LDIEEEMTNYSKEVLLKNKSKNLNLEYIYDNNIVEFITGDGNFGLEEKSPFDVIIINCALNEVPRHLFGQLSNGGTILAIIGESSQKIYLFEKKDSIIYQKTLKYSVVASEIKNSLNKNKTLSLLNLNNKKNNEDYISSLLSSLSKLNKKEDESFTNISSEYRDGFSCDNEECETKNFFSGKSFWHYTISSKKGYDLCENCYPKKKYDCGYNLKHVFTCLYDALFKKSIKCEKCDELCIEYYFEKGDLILCKDCFLKESEKFYFNCFSILSKGFIFLFLFFNFYKK